MKKVSMVSLLSFIFLLIASAVTCILKAVTFTSAWIPLIIGVVILIVSGIIALIIREKTAVNIFCYVLSGVALGFCIKAWYILRGFNNPFWVLVLVSLACISYLWVVYGLSRFSFAHNHPGLFMFITLALSLVCYILLVIYTKTTYVSTFGYYMIIEIAFLFAMFASSEDWHELVRNVTLSTYSVFVVAILIALMILSGDGADFDFDFDFSFDGLDFGSGSSSPKKQKVKNDNIKFD